MKTLALLVVMTIGLGCGTIGTYAGTDLHIGFGRSWLDGFLFPSELDVDIYRVSLGATILIRPDQN